VNWISAAFITILFPIAIADMGTPAYMFMAFAASCFGGFLVNQMFMV
jgi:hypothetical protein